MGPEAQLFQGRIHLVGNRGARGEQTQRESAAQLCNRDAWRELEEHWKRCGLEEGESELLLLLCALFSSKSRLTHTMAVEAAIEALRATLDLVSQTKMGQLFKLLRSFEPSPSSERLFLTNAAFLFQKHFKKIHFYPLEEFFI